MREHAPDDVLADTIATVSLEFLVQVVTPAAGGDLGDELRGTVEIAVP
jgi:hypothetical protein